MCKEAVAKPAPARVQVLTDFENADLNSARHEYFVPIPLPKAWLCKALRDERDLPMLHCLFNAFVVLVPTAALVFYLFAIESSWAWVAGLMHNVLFVPLFLGKLVLLLHFWSHVPVLHSKAANQIVADVISTLLRLPAGVYHMHHVRMHHMENNQRRDASTTNPYQRDSPLHFLMYYLRFAHLVWVETLWYGLSYIVKRGAYSELPHLLGGAASFPLAVYLLPGWCGWGPVVWILVIPHCITFLGLAFGNFSQHMFVDPKQPTDNYLLTYNCVDAFENKMTFNDGYHILHHENARRHWSELPSHFHANLRKYKEKRAITFRGVHFVDVGLLVMFRRWERLAQCYVHIPGAACGLPADEPPTIPEVIALLKSRVQPIRTEYQ